MGGFGGLGVWGLGYEVRNGTWFHAVACVLRLELRQQEAVISFCHHHVMPYTSSALTKFVIPTRTSSSGYKASKKNLF